MCEELKNFGHYPGRVLHLMVGVPNYGTYMRYMQETHPGQTVMIYGDFFHERQDTRYAGRVNRCC